MPTPADLAQELESLHHSDKRLVRTVDSLDPAAWNEPSLLPDWSRAHVIAHLALNAEGFAGALHGLATGAPVAIYPSNEARDAGIEELAGAEPDELRERLFAATQKLRDVMELLTPADWDGTVNRLPDGPVWPAPSLVESRQREVEIHHADLGAGYGYQDWPIAFATALLDHTAQTQEFAVRATDLGRTWSAGAEEPVVSGTAAELGWWLVGRGRGDGLSCPGGLPQVGSWQRAR